jgi:AcrR family transcriptional regulator
MGTRQERKERITEQRRQQILDAALTVFSRKGYGEATIPDIAQEAGTAVGTIYNYYASKRDLLLSIFTTFVFTQPFVELLEHTLEADDRTFLSLLIEDRLNFGFENMDRFFFLLSEVQRDPELRQQYAQEVLGPVLLLLEKYLDSRVASGAFRPMNTSIAARTLGGAMIGFLLLCRIEGEGIPLRSMSRKELAANLADLVLKGLLHSAERT